MKPPFAPPVGQAIAFCRLSIPEITRVVTTTPRQYPFFQPKIPVLRAPKNEDWGARTFDLYDPSGNMLFVMGPVQ